MMPMFYGGGMWGLWGLLMMLIPMAILGLVIYWAVRSGIRNALGPGQPDAMETIKARYARNEITAEEFKRMKEDLSR